MPFFSLIKANARIGELEAKVIELEGELAKKANVDSEAAQAIKDKEAENKALVEANNKLTGEIEAAKAAVTDFEAKVEKAASAKALNRTADAGSAPVPGVIPTEAQKEPVKKELKGLAKVQAAFAAQSGRQ